MFLVLLLTVPTKKIFAQIEISEILPNPSGSKQEETEFIEIYNASNDSVDISNWTIDDIIDGGSKPFTIPSGTTIGAREYRVFYRGDTKVALNNDSDTASILDQESAVISQLSYSSTTEDVSFVRVNSVILSCESPSPGTDTSCTAPTETPVPTNTPVPPTPTTKPIATSKPTTTITHVVSTIKTPMITQGTIQEPGDPTSVPKTAYRTDSAPDSESSRSGSPPMVSHSENNGQSKPTHDTSVLGESTERRKRGSVMFMISGLLMSTSAISLWRKRHISQ